MTGHFLYRASAAAALLLVLVSALAISAAEAVAQTKSPANSAQKQNTARTVQVTTSVPELGMGLSLVTPQARESMSLRHGSTGALVATVSPDGLAAQKGLMAGDMIVQIEQEIIFTPEDVLKQIAMLRQQGVSSAVFDVVSPEGYLRFLRIPLSSSAQTTRKP
jgi:serine protease Do